MPLQETSGSASYDAFGGGAAERVFIEEVFSTYLYTGNGSTQTITNGIDLAGEGGLVWVKKRNSATDGNHILFDTARGQPWLSTNTTSAQLGSTGYINYNSDGFGWTFGSASWNNSGDTFASWTFRKQPKFFDIVTWTGNGSNRTISHNLGSVPGCIIVKRTDSVDNWQVYHRANTTAPQTDYLVLNTTDATVDDDTRWNDTLPTSTVFSLGTASTVNASGGTYVAYIFAHDAGGFGLSGTDNVISCGSYNSTGSTSIPVTLGFEPQWIMVKNAGNGSANWNMFDVMRGWPVGGNGQSFRANTSAAEAAEFWFEPTATGFIVRPGPNLEYNESGGYRYIYIAIRRGPMKVPTSGTSVFSPASFLGTGSYPITVNSLNAADVAIIKEQTSGGSGNVYDRLRAARLFTDLSNAEFVSSGWALGQSGVTIGNAVNDLSKYYATWLFRRAPGFFDVVCDTGTGSAHTITHNLGAVPELMIRKKRSAADNWIVYANNDPTDYLILNSTAATADLDTMWNDTAPTSTVFTVGTNDDVNQNTGTFVTYLFATVAGVSKVGSYTGNGSSQTINCGFTGSARFVLIKRINSTGDWYVWDSARGIVAGNDPHLSLNDAAAEVTTDDSVDTDSTGFIVNQLAATNINVSSANYIFLAIA